VLAVGGVIGMEHLLVDDGLDDFMQQIPQMEAMPVAVEVPEEQYQVFQATGTDGGFATAETQARGLSDVARDSEQKMILSTLDRLNGSRKDAALELGISPRTLRYKLAKMKDLGLAIPR
jgi:two-component system response regulator FlrC